MKNSIFHFIPPCIGDEVIAWAIPSKEKKEKSRI
jgi:hypothetical protein